jgi:hypothetical protein
MKIISIICVGVAIAIPKLALAKLPFENSVFGKVESTLDFCSQVDPPSASKYEAKKTALVEGIPEKEVAEARESKEYKDGYDEAKSELSKESKDDVASTCKALLQSDKAGK